MDNRRTRRHSANYYSEGESDRLSAPSTAQLMADIEKTETLKRSLHAVDTGVQTNHVHSGALHSARASAHAHGTYGSDIQNGSLSFHGPVKEPNRETVYASFPLGQTVRIETEVDGSQRSFAAGDHLQTNHSAAVLESSRAQHGVSHTGTSNMFSEGETTKRTQLEESVAATVEQKMMEERRGGERSQEHYRRSWWGNLYQYCCDGRNTSRGNWDWRSDFSFASLVLSVGIGNVWRLPAVFYANGGAAFFIPYFLVFFLLAVPLYMLEVVIGQYSGCGPLTSWRMAPLFVGIGGGMVIAMCFLAVYFSTYVAWAVLYLIGSFNYSPVWFSCNNTWNTANCFQNLPDVNCTLTNQVRLNNGTCLNVTSGGVSFLSGVWNTTALTLAGFTRKLSAEEYFHTELLGLSDSRGIQYPGTINWRVLLAFLAVWFFVFLAHIRGMRSIGKVTYMTGIVWIGLLLAIFIRAMTYQDSGRMLGLFFQADWDALATIQAWSDATIQALFTLICGWGAAYFLGSYQKFHSKSLTDCFIVSIIIFGIHVLILLTAGVYIAMHAQFLGTSIRNIIQSEFLMPFVVMPACLSSIRMGTLWTVIFFVLLILSGYDTLFLLVGAISDAIADVSPRQLFPRRTRLAAVIILLLLLVGLSTTTHGGVYVVHLLNSHVIGWPIMVLAICECVVILWIYGWQNLSANMEEMYGQAPFLFWRIMWGVITPLGFLAMLVLTLVHMGRNYMTLQYGGLIFPAWAVVLGWLVSAVIVLLVLLGALFMLCCGTCDDYCGKRFRMLCRPSYKWGPGADRHRHYHALDGMISTLDSKYRKDTKELMTISGAVGHKYPPTDASEVNEYEIQQVQLRMDREGNVDDVKYTSRDDIDGIGLQMDEISLSANAASYNVSHQLTPMYGARVTMYPTGQYRERAWSHGSQPASAFGATLENPNHVPISRTIGPVMRASSFNTNHSIHSDGNLYRLNYNTPNYEGQSYTVRSVGNPQHSYINPAYQDDLHSLPGLVVTGPDGSTRNYSYSQQAHNTFSYNADQPAFML